MNKYYIHHVIFHLYIPCSLASLYIMSLVGIGEHEKIFVIKTFSFIFVVEFVKFVWLNRKYLHNKLFLNGIQFYITKRLQVFQSKMVVTMVQKLKLKEKVFFVKSFKFRSKNCWLWIVNYTLLSSLGLVWTCDHDRDSPVP